MSAPRVVLAIRVRALRRKTSVRLVWMYLATSLPLHEPMTIKVARTAALLGIPKRRMRAALDQLVRFHYLVRVAPATAGTPGMYRFGRRATASALPTGDSAAPVPASDQLLLIEEAA